MTPPDQDSSPPGRSRRSARSLAPWLVPLLVLIAAVLGFFDTMRHTGERVAGTNSVTPQGTIFEVHDRQTACQATLLPKGARTVMLWVKREEGYSPRITLTFTSQGRRIAAGHLDENWAGDFVRIPIDRASRTYPDATMCIRADGPKGFWLSGIPSQFLIATLDGQPQGTAIAVEFYRAGNESWWGILPTIAHRAGVLKGSLAGAWAFWAALVLLLVVAILAGTVVLRAAREQAP